MKQDRLIFHAVERHDKNVVKDGLRYVIHDQEYLNNINRRATAHRSWDVLYEKHGVIPCHLWNYPRDATAIGDRRALPYLRDVLQPAMDKADDHDIIMFTNDDVYLHPMLADLVMFHVSLHDACCAQRCEFHGSLPANANPETFASLGAAHLGRDLFAFTKVWLKAHWEDIGDPILGASEFDLHLACIIRLDKGIVSTRQNFIETIPPCELPRGYVAHQWHSPAWAHPNNLNAAPSQKHNRLNFKRWATEHLPSLKFDANNCV